MGLKDKYHEFHVVESTHRGRLALGLGTTSAESPRLSVGTPVMVAVPLCGVKTHDSPRVNVQRCELSRLAVTPGG